MTVDTGTLATELGSVCPSWRQLDPSADSALAVDGRVPSLWCEPTTPEQAGAVLALADGRGAAVLPRGGGSRMGLGNPPRGADILLSTRGLNRVIDYEPADLTVTVEAGLGLADLQAQLAAQGQMLALDPPCADIATIGGVIASNASGPTRLIYGSARDLVIGIRVANSSGVLTRAGGRVVKNVAGYDLNKLYTGSLGTLGLIVELSFKLHPLPRSRATVLARFDHLDAAAALVRRVMRSPLGPAALEALDPAAAQAIGLDAPDGGCLLAVQVAGFEKAVERVTTEIGEYCREEGGQAESLADAEDSQQLWSAIRELPAASDTERPLLKLAVPPARSIEALGRLRTVLRGRQLPGLALVHAGTGLAYARLEPRRWSNLPLEALTAAVAELRQYAAQAEGSLVVEAAPLALKEQLDVWGEIGPSLRLMKSLKAQLDPRNTINPGRFVGGI